MTNRRLLERAEKILLQWAEDPYLIATKRDLSIQAYALTSSLWVADPLPADELKQLSDSFCTLCRAINQKPCACESFEDCRCTLLG